MIMILCFVVAIAILFACHAWLSNALKRARFAACLRKAAEIVASHRAAVPCGLDPVMMADSPFNSAANVYTLADAVAQNPDVKGKVWSRMLEVGANTIDDFTFLEGPPESKKPFWKKTELAADGGDTVVFSTIGDVGGPGVRGEKELTGSTSKPRMGAYSCQVDYWRDAVELTKKQLKFLAAGKSLETVLLGMLSRKLGRQKMYDMMMSLIRKANGNILRPNGKTSTSALRATDTLTPSFLVDAKARLSGLGARPVDMTKSKSGSPVLHYLAFIGQDALVDIRNSTSYQNALLQAQTRGDDNPLFSGKLVDWQGMYIWEHIIVDADADDCMGSPIAPKAQLGVAITAGNTAPLIQQSATNTLPLYFGFFDGYDWIWIEGQTPTVDGNTYYFWIVNTSGGNIGYAGFYSYTGSTGNTGNTIQTAQRLRAAASGSAVATLGQVAWDATTMIDSHPVGSWIIPANQYGVPIARNFVFGAGAALRAYGSVEADPIYQDRDYKFVKGMGYESIFGQTPTFDTQGKPRNYVVLETAFEHPGITVPYVTT